MIYFGAVVLKAYAWPNDRNSATQHIPTLLAQYLQALVKRSQHFDATYRNIVGRNMLRAFGHRVATRCGMLRVENQTVHMPWRNIVARTWPNDYNIMQHPQMLGQELTIFKFEPTTPNISQDIAICRTMVAKSKQHSAFKCCDRLAGALNVYIWNCFRAIFEAQADESNIFFEEGDVQPFLCLSTATKL